MTASASLQTILFEAACEPMVTRASSALEFAYDGGGLGKGGTVSLYVDGEKTVEGRVDRSTPNIFSVDDKTDVRR